MARAASGRLEFRLRTEVKDRIQRAADLAQVAVGDFVRQAAEARAEEVIRSNASTVVPDAFFDQLLAALDQTPQANSALRRSTARAGKIVVSR